VSPTPTPSPSPSPGAGSGGTHSSGSHSSGAARPSGSTTASRTVSSSGSNSGDDASSTPRSGSSSADASSPATPTDVSAPPAPPNAPGPAPFSEAPGKPKEGQPAPDPLTTTAVQTALSTEYAAVWCYSLVEAFLPEALDKHAREDLTAHRVRRDATIRLLTDSGVRPVPAEPAYRTPAPVTDQTSAMRLVVTAESDAAAAWRSVLERCDDPGLRRVALDGLTDAAVRGGRWSQQLGTKPVVPAFPGRA